MRQGNIITRLAALEVASRKGQPLIVELSWDHEVQLGPTRPCHQSEHGTACTVEESTGRHVIQLRWG